MIDSNSIHEKTQRTLSAAMHRLGRDSFQRSDFLITRPWKWIVPGLDPVFDGYRIVHFTDIHLGHWVSSERLEGIVSLINEQQPDLVVNTGDFVSYVFDELEQDMISSFRRISARMARWLCWGITIIGWTRSRYARHCGREDFGCWTMTWRRSAGAERICILPAWMMSYAEADRLDQVMERMPETGPALILVHEPDFADETAATGRFFLQLSGHSHGMQIRVPGARHLLRARYFKKYPAGRYQVKGMVQYTSNGVGTHALRLRINCPPEIVVVTLKAVSRADRLIGSISL